MYLYFDLVHVYILLLNVQIGAEEDTAHHVTGTDPLPQITDVSRIPPPVCVCVCVGGGGGGGDSQQL